MPRRPVSSCVEVGQSRWEAACGCDRRESGKASRFLTAALPRRCLTIGRPGSYARRS